MCTHIDIHICIYIHIYVYLYRSHMFYVGLSGILLYTCFFQVMLVAQILPPVVLHAQLGSTRMFSQY